MVVRHHTRQACLFVFAALGGVLGFLASSARATAAIVVAAADSQEQEKARADLVCDGVDDDVELAASLAKARQGEALVDVDPKTQRRIKCAMNHAVEWLPGSYHLSKTLEIPSASNCVIHAEGTALHYDAKEGDAVVIRGMNGCRYTFGTIETQSSGAAIRVRPSREMPALQSFVDFSGLIGHDQRGVGLMLDPTDENVCVNRFVGTDISGFDKGVLVGGAGSREKSASTMGKCDTNWFWMSYVRLCNTCVEEGSQGVDCSVWEVNVDASLPGAVAVRAGGAYGKWFIIMGTFTYEKMNKALVLERGARECAIEVHPPLDNFAWEDNSGNDTNKIGGQMLRLPKNPQAVRSSR
jgi:hypothetical protein